MIKTRADLLFYLESDRLSLKIKKRNWKKIMYEILIPNSTYKFQKILRKTEYYYNKKKNILEFVLLGFYFLRYKNLSVRYGFSIPLNVFGPGLSIVHIGTIVVNPAARIGANCRIHVCTNIGASGGGSEAPIIGDNVYIAPGVKIYGNIKIADNIAFAANAAVASDCLESGMLYGGVPAKVIGPVAINRLLKHI